jgi:hypothetical protein
MAQIVSAKFADPSALENVSRAARNPVVTSNTRPLFPDCSRQGRSTCRFIIQRHMTGLSTLCIPAFDGEKPTVEVHAQCNLIVSPRRSPVFMDSSTVGGNRATRTDLQHGARVKSA